MTSHRFAVVVAAAALAIGSVCILGTGIATASTVPTLTGVVDGQMVNVNSAPAFVEIDLTGRGEIILPESGGFVRLRRLVATADDCAGPAARCELISVTGPPANPVGTLIDILNFAPRPPLILPGTAYIAPGTSGTTPLHLPVVLSYASTQNVTVQWRTVFVPGAPGNQAAPSTDYVSASGTLTFPPGTTQEDATILVNGGTTVVPGEYFVVQYGNPTNATMGGFWGLGFGGIT